MYNFKLPGYSAQHLILSRLRNNKKTLQQYTLYRDRYTQNKKIFLFPLAGFSLSLNTSTRYSCPPTLYHNSSTVPAGLHDDTFTNTTGLFCFPQNLPQLHHPPSISQFVHGSWNFKMRLNHMDHFAQCCKKDFY